jgi:hypothetical protein
MTFPFVDIDGEHLAETHWSYSATIMAIVALCTAFWAALASLLLFS